MTKPEILGKAILRAQENGYEWNERLGKILYQISINTVTGRWHMEDKLYYAIIFDKHFAFCLWGEMKPGVAKKRERLLKEYYECSIYKSRDEIISELPVPDDWEYHYSRMASAEDPLEYILKTFDDE